MIAVNDAVTPGCDLCQEDGAGQVRQTNGLLVQMRTVAVLGKLRDLYLFDRETIDVLLDEGQKPSDIELEDPVCVDLIFRIYGIRSKSPLQSQSGRMSVISVPSIDASISEYPNRLTASIWGHCCPGT